MENQVLAVCRGIAQSRSNRDARLILEGLLCAQWGWDYYFYLAPLPGHSNQNQAEHHALMMTNYPVDWLYPYLTHNRYQVDPLIAHCFNRNLGLAWSTEAADMAGRDGDPVEFLPANQLPGPYRGVAIPVPAPPVRGALILVSARPSNQPRPLFGTTLLAGATLGLHLYEALLAITMKRMQPTANRRKSLLSDLEREILQRTADGQSGKQVAGEMQLSAKTVERHIEKIRERLGAPNRAKMLVKAVAFGLPESCPEQPCASIANAQGYRERLERLFSGAAHVPAEQIHDYLYGELDGPGLN